MASNGQTATLTDYSTRYGYLKKWKGYTMSKEKKKWVGELPKTCDICRVDLHKQFFGKIFHDTKTKMGPWGILCDMCEARWGAGIGQTYCAVTGNKLKNIHGKRGGL